MATPNLANYSSPLQTGKKYSLKYGFMTIGHVSYSELSATSSVSTGSYKNPPYVGSTKSFDVNMQVTGENVGTIALNGGKAQDCTFSESGNTLTIHYGSAKITITKNHRGPKMNYQGHTLQIRS